MSLKGEAALRANAALQEQVRFVGGELFNGFKMQLRYCRKEDGHAESIL